MPNSNWSTQNKLNGIFINILFCVDFFSFRFLLAYFDSCCFVKALVWFLLCWFVLFILKRENREYKFGEVGRWGGSRQKWGRG